MQGVEEGGREKGVMMFETVQMTFAVPNILLSVPLLASMIAEIFFIERWLSSREGDFANHGSVATNQGLKCSALGARAVCGSSGRRTEEASELGWPVWQELQGATC